MTLDEARNILGVDADADEKTVRRAYAKLAKTYRPDTHPTEFAQVRDAYDCLLQQLQEDDYEDPTLPLAPSVQGLDDDNTALPPRRAVAYVIDERERTMDARVGQPEDSDDEQDAPQELGNDAEAMHEVNTVGAEKNPLQALEDELIDAIKAVKPGQLDSENHVVLLVDNYLSAANNTSRQWRDYVERFLIGACLGDYYLPHAVRERVANFCGLGDAVVAEHKLRPWEKEFLSRFDESEIVEELLTQAASRRNRAEHALVHDTSNATTIMLRLDSTAVSVIQRWVHWLDNTYGVDAGIVNEQFRQRWHKLRQIEPLTASVLCLFAALMVFSGLLLEKLGLPLGSLFQLPTSSMVPMVVGLMVLSWANFVLVLLAKPVLRQYLFRIREALYSRVPVPLLWVEGVACLGLIAGWALQPVLPSALAGLLIFGCGFVMVLLGVFTRTWAWVDHLSFSALALRALWYYLVVFVAYDLSGESHWVSSIGLVVGLTVVCAPPRALMLWFDRDKAGARIGRVSIRYRDVEFPLQWAKVFIAVGSALCLLAVILNVALLSTHSAVLSGVITTVLVTLLALELAVSGGVHDEQHSSRRRVIGYSALLVGAWFAARLNLPVSSTALVQSGLAVMLLWCVFFHLSNKHTSN